MAKRTYESDALRVFWDSERCIHFAHCIRTGEGAFDTRRRPWVDLSVADTATVVAAVEGCPSGALRYERLDGAEGEVPAATVSIVPLPNGPLAVRGDFIVQDRHGDEFVTGPRAVLCRCGASKRQPLCDLSHREIGFRDAPRPDPGGE